MTRRLAALLLVPFALVACADPPTSASAPGSVEALVRGDRLPAAGARGLTVMTRNLYLGGDIFAVAAATSPAQVPLLVTQLWQQIVASNFPERAGAIAEEIAEASPHLVGLQEVPIYRIDPVSDAIVGGTRPATAVALDFLAVLQAELAARGLCYNVAAVVTLSDIEMPMIVATSPTLKFSDIRYTDRDVILARCDVPTSDPRSGVYTARLTLNVGGFPVTVLRGWTSVLATVGGVTYRFANTHLEVNAFPVIQLAQARELIAVLAGETHPVVLVGDFNSAADGSQTATYGVLLSEGGFVDAWSEAHPRDPGYTSGLPANLIGPPELETRIDLVLVRYDFNASPNAGIVGGVHADVIGEELDDRTATGLWPSDHAGVVVTLRAPKAIGKEKVTAKKK